MFLLTGRVLRTEITLAIGACAQRSESLSSSGSTSSHSSGVPLQTRKQVQRSPRNFMSAKLPKVCVCIKSLPFPWIGFLHGAKRADLLHPMTASALYVIGIAAGALFAGPVAETTGRNPIYIFSRCVHLAFILGSALAPNLGAQLACRFLAGLGASTILAIHAASIADLFEAHDRSLAWPFVASGSFFGE